MLTRDLLRYRVEAGQVRPTLLKATPAIRELAERLLGHWRAGVGSSLGDLEEGSGRICHAARSSVVARGLQKLVVDACRFGEVADQGERRWPVLAASAELLTATPAPTAAAHRAAVQVRLEALGEGEPPDDLYADLPGAALLASAPDWSGEGLIRRYNVELVQGLLLSAGELTVVLPGAGAGRRRQVLKALRFQRLLAEVVADGGDLTLRVSGPGSVLDQATRYGLQLANFLPVVLAEAPWRLTASIRPDRRAPPLRLELDEGSGLVASTPYLGHVPEELQGLVERLGGKRPAWTLSTEAPLSPIAGSGELVVPDLAVTRADGRRIDVEFFHRWHLHALERRLRQLAEGLAPQLVVGVERSLAKRKQVAPLLDSPIFQTRGFLFSGFPAPSALIKTIEGLEVR